MPLGKTPTLNFSSRGVAVPPPDLSGRSLPPVIVPPPPTPFDYNQPVPLPPFIPVTNQPPQATPLATPLLHRLIRLSLLNRAYLQRIYMRILLSHTLFQIRMKGRQGQGQGLRVPRGRLDLRVLRVLQEVRHLPVLPGLQGLRGRLDRLDRLGLRGRLDRLGHRVVQGHPGHRGSQGRQGKGGVLGLRDLQGIPGRQGHRGLQGSQGRQGKGGVLGLKGSQGRQEHRVEVLYLSIV
jgi:hypothetical protein